MSRRTAASRLLLVLVLLVLLVCLQLLMILQRSLLWQHRRQVVQAVVGWVLPSAALPQVALAGGMTVAC
jgi:cell division protein FtsB